MMGLKTALIIAVLACFSVGTVFTVIYKRGVHAAEQAEHDRQVAAFALQVQKSDQIAKYLEAELDSMKMENQKLNESLKNEINTHVVYRSCVLPVSGLQLLNQSRLGTQSPATR